MGDYFLRLTFILIIAHVLVLASFANFAVLLPEFVTLWSLTNTEAGWIGGIIMAGYVVAVPILVSMTDVIDAKKVFIVGILLGVVGSFGFAFYADGFWSALFFRFLSGISVAGTYMPGLQIINDRVDVDHRERVIPWYLGTVGVGTGLSFFITGWLAEYMIWNDIFVVAGLLQAISLFIILTLVPNVKIEASRRRFFDFRPVFKNQLALAYIVAYAGHTFELFAFRAWVIALLVFSVMASESTATRVQLGTIVAGFSFLGVATSIIGAKIAYLRSRKVFFQFVVLFSFAIGASLGFLLDINFPIFLMVVALYSGLLMADSAALTAGTVNAAPDGALGVTLAVHSVIGFSGGILGPLVIGLVLDLSGGQGSQTAWTMACLAMAGGPLVTLAVFKLMLRRHHQP
ncbi:MAG: MFS transporter [Acidiferrobacteraceae bacterium]|nr:MFS transporter [Acidiferrobacteraceae bacterium]